MGANAQCDQHYYTMRSHLGTAVLLRRNDRLATDVPNGQQNWLGCN